MEATAESTAAASRVRRLLRDWRVQLAAVCVAASCLRGLFFVGFGLGDDNGYVALVSHILEGGYPSLDPLNQYAYRPLLLYLWAAGVAVFGFTDLGVVAPVVLASIATIAIIHALVRHRFGPGAALWCAVLFAFQPFNVVDSTTMTNDVILSCLVFGAVATFLIADAEQRPGRMRRLFVAAAALMIGAFLVKMTMFPAVCALGLYSTVNMRRRAGTVLRGHMIFYVGVLIGLACICFGYYLKTGNPLWQFRSEFLYYETNKPDWYLRGNIDYRFLMMQYPQSLFGLSGYGPFTFLDHGVLFWLFLPSAIWAVVTRNRILSFLVVMAVCIFLFFEFYPQYLTPRYLPLGRQTRYLEMLVPPVVTVVGVALYQLWRRQPLVASLLLIAVLGDFVYEASRRWLMFDDSQQDMRALAEYASTTIKPSGKTLSVDGPANASLQFYLRDSGVPLTTIEHQPSEDSYVAVGGARSFWWSTDLVFNVRRESVPMNWVLAYEVPGLKMPWRPSNLRVYYVGAAPALFIPPLQNESTSCQRGGLRQTPYPAGFGGEPAPSLEVARIPEIDAGTPIPAPHLEWTADFRSDGGTYTFETTSDDGSWVYLNDQLALDNGGTHAAKTARRTVLLGHGIYRFRLRYEDTGGVQFLRVRVYQSSLDGHATPVAWASLCLPAGQGLAGAFSSR